MNTLRSGLIYIDKHYTNEYIFINSLDEVDSKENTTMSLQWNLDDLDTDM